MAVAVAVAVAPFVPLAPFQKQPDTDDDILTRPESNAHYPTTPSPWPGPLGH